MFKFKMEDEAGKPAVLSLGDRVHFERNETAILISVLPAEPRKSRHFIASGVQDTKLYVPTVIKRKDFQRFCETLMIFFSQMARGGSGYVLLDQPGLSEHIRIYQIQ